MLMAIFGLTYDDNHTVAKDAVLSLINLTAEEQGAVQVFELAKKVQPVGFVLKISFNDLIVNTFISDLRNR